ncbi:hypothetical protein [uncultured Desulfovibrio sp.]|uniref:Uncharacterized protein n=1 Tax=Candidatus Desulfovibrio intestinavium TaxID=2838534 RepID=A0A9D2KQK0_9BACT|nr:hypothetical protein [uncultured Desulfovibrio sp.]HJA79872.1 hypothetical protein [Candidatus Desulfovibrio intestinavium]
MIRTRPLPPPFGVAGPSVPGLEGGKTGRQEGADGHKKNTKKFLRLLTGAEARLLYLGRHGKKNGEKLSKKEKNKMMIVEKVMHHFVEKSAGLLASVGFSGFS